MNDPRRRDPDPLRRAQDEAPDEERPWREEEQREAATSVPIDVPEADAAEQSQTWSPEEEAASTSIPPDVSEPDALDQARPAGLDEERE